MKRTYTLFAVLVLLITAQFGAAQTQEEKDLAAFISNAKLLERKPFDTNAPAARSWGFKWLADTDKVTVVLCEQTMRLIPEKKNKFKAELLMHFTFGQAVFKLENPDQKDDENAAQLAGVESMLRTYEQMVSENEKARNAELDGLIVKRENGELKALVESKKCDNKPGKSE